jgi:tRNA-2-methylthio-N6-dimethylallyladenosine synthase
MDLSPELVRCFREVRSLMPHFHLPVQHGSNAVLQRMRRKYTIAEYEERIAQLPAHVALTSDIICGFPGETDAEHEENLAFLRRTPFDNLFSFIYSARPHTGAILKLDEWGEVPRELALRRLDEVQELQKARTRARHEARIGSEVEVLVEAVDGLRRFGRSRENWTIHFEGTASVGDLVRVSVERAGLLAVNCAEVAVVDRARPAPRPSRTRLAVVSA